SRFRPCCADPGRTRRQTGGESRIRDAVDPALRAGFNVSGSFGSWMTGTTMSSTETEDLPGSLAPVLSAALLARVHELNPDYLELRIAESAAAEGQVRHLPVRVAAAVLALSAQARRLVANLP